MKTVIVRYFISVTWPPNTTATTPEDVVVVENCELTGLCDTLVPGGRTVSLETTEAVAELETSTVMVEEETTTGEVEETTTPELDEIPTPAKIFV